MLITSSGTYLLVVNNGTGILNFIDISGKIIFQETIGLADGRQHIELNVSPLPIGIYMVQFVSEEGISSVSKLVIAR